MPKSPFVCFETQNLLKGGAVPIALNALLLTRGLSYRLSPGWKYPVGGEPGWDYINIDPGTRRLFVSHVTGMEVLDADSGKVIGHIADTPGVHGIALASEFGKGFVGNGKTDTVSVIDLEDTGARIAELKAGKKPDAMAV